MIIERFCKDCGNAYTDEKKSSMCPPCRSRLGKRNKRKGNSNELRFAKYLQEQFDLYELPYRARRTPRSGAIHDFEPADIMLSGPDINSVFKHVHFENKDTEHWYIEEWFRKAVEIEREKGLNRQPVIIMRKPNSSDEFAVVRKEFLIELMVVNDVLRKDK